MRFLWNEGMDPKVTAPARAAGASITPSSKWCGREPGALWNVQNASLLASVNASLLSWVWNQRKVHESLILSMCERFGLVSRTKWAGCLVEWMMRGMALMMLSWPGFWASYLGCQLCRSASNKQHRPETAGSLIWSFALSLGEIYNGPSGVLLCRSSCGCLSVSVSPIMTFKMKNE